MNKTLVSWHEYRYFPYEKELAQKEIEGLFGSCKFQSLKDGIEIEEVVDTEVLHRLVYFKDFYVEQEKNFTLQYQLEQASATNGRQRKQSTRYSVHGLHEYKGKFNPQIVSGLFNILGLDKQCKILDPFCGSGTTLVEAAHRGINAIGFDINPLAVYISNAKLLALKASPEELVDEYQLVLDRFEKEHFDKNNTDRMEYLTKWFPERNLAIFERLRFAFRGLKYESIFLVLTSNLLRDYSLQEPADLRIRRRKSEFPEESINQALDKSFNLLIENINNLKKVIPTIHANTISRLQDVRIHNEIIGETFDAAITSPPYATALPYIDTQRLSLVWLDLLNPKQIRELEANLTGSREWIMKNKLTWEEKFQLNAYNLPDDVYEFCKILKDSISNEDGFRRESKPFLLYRYFSEMKNSFKFVKNCLVSGGQYALVVGVNLTTLGGKRHIIDTPKLLVRIAVEDGWKLDEFIDLQTYQRYGIHKNNSVKNEKLIILRK